MVTLVSPGVSVSVVDISVFIPSVTFYRIIDEAIVDGTKWYSIRMSNDVFDWLNTQDADLWATDSIRQTFDVHEELLVIMKLRFPNESFSNSRVW